MWHQVFQNNRKKTAWFLKLVVRAPGTYASQLRTSTYHTSIVHRAYTPNDLLLLFIKDLLVMGNQYFWWASKI
jgi:predicted deacetylase